MTASTMRDLSLNGMQLVSAIRLRQNQLVKIECDELHALGRVAYITPHDEAPERFTTGIEFLTLRFRRLRGSSVSAGI